MPYYIVSMYRRGTNVPEPALAEADDIMGAINVAVGNGMGNLAPDAEVDPDSAYQKFLMTRYGPLSTEGVIVKQVMSVTELLSYVDRGIRLLPEPDGLDGSKDLKSLKEMMRSRKQSKFVPLLKRRK